MLSLWANWLVTKFGLNSLKRYLWPVLYGDIVASKQSYVDNWWPHNQGWIVFGQLKVGVTFSIAYQHSL